METDKINLSSGAEVTIYDNAFPMGFREDAYFFIKKSLFCIGWADKLTSENMFAYDQHLHSVFSQKDIQNLGIFNYIKNIQGVPRGVNEENLTRAVVNLSLPSDVYQTHIHRNEYVALYYANTYWQDGYHGKTLFFNQTKNKIDLALPYVPGRLILFDGETPHTIRPQSVAGPTFRFTLALFFNKSNF